jgi:CRISPR-associated protein Cas2
MMVLVTYDVETITAKGRRRLRRVAKQCMNFGQRVQNSVFECVVAPAQLTELKHRLENIIDVEKDSLRYYHMGNNWEKKVNHVGAKETYNPEEDTLII